MKKISTWGKHNKAAARVIIIISSIILILLGLNLGYKLKEAGLLLPFSLFTGITCVYFISILVYPYKTLRIANHPASYNYVRRKTLDLVIAFCSFSMFLFVGNRPGGVIHLGNAVYAAVPLNSPSKEIKPFKSISSFSKSIKDENGKLIKWKERKKLLKEQLKSVKSSKDLSRGEKTLLTILSILVASGLLLLVGALACGISCNGSAAGAIIVGVGGTALIIWLLIITLRAINRAKVKEKKREPDSTGS